MGDALNKLRAKGFKLEPTGNSNFAKAVRLAGVQRTKEFERVFHLPRRVLDLKNVPDLTDIFRHTEFCKGGCQLCAHGPARLFPIQSAMIAEAVEMNGLFAGAAVGSGKELTALLLPGALESKMTLYFVKPALKHQLLQKDLPLYARHFTVAEPSDSFKIVTYSDLSITKNAEMLDQYKPDLYILNEAQALRRTSAARTKRFLYSVKQNPHARHCVLTGTPVKSSVLDYAKLLQLALRGFCPLPLEYTDLRDWALAIDPPNVAKTGFIMRPGVLEQLCEEGESVQSGYRRRLVQTPGVVMSEEGSLGAPLILECERWIPDVVTTSALAELERKWCWDGVEYDEAAIVSEVRAQLAAGFYYKLDWPGGVVDTEWVEAKNAWAKFVRNYTRRSIHGVDSPKLVWNACARGDLESTEFEAWKAVKHRKEPPKKTVWISSWFVDRLIEEAKKLKHGIVWFDHGAIAEKLIERGFRKQLFVAGDNAAIDNTTEPLIFATYAHATGKNLQRYSQNLITEPPASNELWEQMIGRTHREGQLADEVYGKVVMTCSTHENALIRAWKEERDVVYATTWARRKLFIASRINWPEE